jgi:HD-GYP domain-containing protein (c-di-GMP phosphodiesterase class II)
VEVVLNDSSISRNHAEVSYVADAWIVRDLGSTNGTFLNGIRLGRTGQPLRLSDVLQCGNIVLRVEALVSPLMEGTEAGDSLQVQAVADQSLEQAAHKLALEITQSARPGEQLLHLLQAGQFLNWTDSLDELLQRNLEDTARALGARRGAVVLIDEQTAKMSLRAIYPAAQPDLVAGRYYSQTLACRCFRGGQSLLCADVIRDPEMLQAQSVQGGHMSSVICALLRSPRRYLGIIHLDRGPSDNPFTTEDLHRADALAVNLAFAFENAQHLQERQQAMFIQTVIAFSQVIEMRDPCTGGHAQRVTDYALLLAEQLRLSETDRRHLAIGAPLHDIGKIGIDDAILRKPGPLSEEEQELMKSHTVMGAALVQTLPGLDIVLPIVRNHHERWDGLGYPDQLARTAIPPLARLLAVADSFDAMTMDRPYRVGMTLDQALGRIEAGAGSQFDPEFARAFLSLRPVLQEHLNRKQALSQTIYAPDFLRSRPPSVQRIRARVNDTRPDKEHTGAAPALAASA